MKYQVCHFQSLIFTFSAFMLLAIVAVKCDRQTAGRRLEQGSKRGEFKSNCGTSEQVAQRIGQCLKPIFELVDGDIETPINDEDLLYNCNRFNTTEKCVRAVAKDCLTGLHKTTVGSVASAVKRFRNGDCRTPAGRNKLLDPQKCTIKKGKEMKAIFRNHTAIMQAVRDLPNNSPEEKLKKTCCVMHTIDREIETTLNQECPKSTPIIIGILFALTEDARRTLCLNTKCRNALDGLIGRPYKPPQTYIEPIVEVLLQLND